MSPRSIAIALLLVVVGAAAQNSAPNHYETVEGWAKLPDGRVWGATSAVYPTNDGQHLLDCRTLRRQSVCRQ